MINQMAFICNNETNRVKVDRITNFLCLDNKFKI